MSYDKFRPQQHGLVHFKGPVINSDAGLHQLVPLLLLRGSQVLQIAGVGVEP